MDETIKRCDHCRTEIPEPRPYYRLTVTITRESRAPQNGEASRSGGSEPNARVGEAELCGEACAVAWAKRQLPPLNQAATREDAA